MVTDDYCHGLGDGGSTLCGRSALGVWKAIVPAGITCEDCLRVMRNLQQSPGRDSGSAPDSSPAAPGGTHAPSPHTEGPVDAVHHPSHYTRGSIECIDAIDALVSQFDDPMTGFYAAQVLKYIWRHEHKGKPLEDLKKAKWYLERLIEKKEKGE